MDLTLYPQRHAAHGVLGQVIAQLQFRIIQKALQSFPADAIISKDDYEAYPLKMGAFVSALRGDLVEKTFLFLGFSFTDPNIDYILSRVRVQYEQHARHHYCIQRKVSKKNGESDEEFKYRELKQDYFIRDLKRFSIYQYR